MNQVEETIERTDEDGEPLRTVGRRNVVAGIAALGLGGAFGVTRAFAQDATTTPPAEDDVEDDDDDLEDDELEEFDEPELEAEFGEAYQNFVAKLAANLGETDTTVVDTAIRDALVAMVEERFAAGDISRNLADEVIERIQTGEAPLAVVMMGGLRMHGIERRRERREDRWDDDDLEDDDDDDGSEDAETNSVIIPSI